MRSLLAWSRPGLGCPQVVELVTDYFEDALTASQRRRFEAHIAACEDCTAYLRQLRALHAQLGRVSPRDLSPGAEQALREAFRDWSAS